MSYSTGPYAKFTSLPVPPRPKLYTARSIDPGTKRYEIDQTTFGYERMPTISQKVIVLCSFGVPTSDFNIESEHQSIRDAIELSLESMVNAGEIKILLIDVGSDERGHQYRRLKYKDLTAGGKDQTVELT